MKLTQATLADITDLQKICVDAYTLNFADHWHYGGLALYLDQEFSTERLAADLNDINIEYYFIEHDQETVGFIKTKRNPTINTTFKITAELEKIYVLPAYTGEGIGKLALQVIIENHASHNYDALFLSVIDTNQSAIAFYKKLGFTYHSKTTLDIPYFKEELKGMHTMVKELNSLK